jgi:cobyrinic acid a,c-diamide synthase
LSCLIGAPCSGSGKTLVSLCLAAAARARGARLQPFKVGPDYLDPQLLSQVAGLPCRNLDPLLCGEDWVRRSYSWHGGQADRVLVEGGLGLVDGRGPCSAGSSAAVAQLLDLPVVLVVEASRQAGSLAALVRGFRDHGPPQVRMAGVVLNRVASERHRALLAEALADLGMPLLGSLPQDPCLDLPSRHLGLLPPHDLPDFDGRLAQWAALADRHLDMERFWALLEPPQPGNEDPILHSLDRVAPLEHRRSSPMGHRPTVAIATDAAFHFRYAETTEFLTAVGLDGIPWSPLADEPLPQACAAVMLPGGYPELHGAQLGQARRSLGQLAAAVDQGLPLVAECGGLMLLGEALQDAGGTWQPMANILPFRAQRGELSLGYRQATVSTNGLLLRRGETLTGHEFHRWQLLPKAGVTTSNGPVAGEPELWQVEGWGSPRRPEGWTSRTVHASWLHIHWAGCPAIPWRLAALTEPAAPSLKTAGFSCHRNPALPPSANVGA